ncbi:zinc-binding dehydrogenase [Actinomyces viscosus]|nr:zinc-binding dehydrogenase [Actinomyces viscosus]
MAVVDLAARGETMLPVSESFALADAAGAHRTVESGHGAGKVVLLP